MSSLNMSLLTTERIDKVPIGYSWVEYHGKKYGVRKRIFNGGRSLKVFAEDLSGRDFISFNYYKTDSGHCMKSCEMPVQKVLDFLEEAYGNEENNGINGEKGN